MSSPTFQAHLQFAHRGGKQARIEQFFSERIGQRLSSTWLHDVWGSSFRSRVADINADRESLITIKNEFFFDEKEGAEVSVYWAESRPRHLDLG